jgi:hypothetical protein
MVSAHERHCIVAPASTGMDAEPVIPCPETPFNFSGYVPPCSKYLYYDAHSETDPYSGVSYQDVACALGVQMMQTTDGQPLAVTQEGDVLAQKIGRDKLPILMASVNECIRALTHRLYPPDILARIQEGDNEVAYNDLIHAIIEGLDPKRQPFEGDVQEGVSMLRCAKKIGWHRVNLCGSGTQHMVFRVDACGSKFICKVPSITTILGMRKVDGISRICPAVSTLLRLQAVRENRKMQDVYTRTDMRVVKPYMATPYMLVEEYCGEGLSMSENDVLKTLGVFDQLTRRKLKSMRQQPDPVGQIMQGVRNYDIFAKGVVFDMESEYVCRKLASKNGSPSHSLYRTDNVTLCRDAGGVGKLVLVDPFRLRPLTKPPQVPDGPFPSWMRTNYSYVGGFDPDIFLSVFK